MPENYEELKSYFCRHLFIENTSEICQFKYIPKALKKDKVSQQ